MICIEKKSRKKIKVRVKRQLHPSNQWIPIGTGNHYKGEWNHRTMSGNGVYVMQNGTVFEGNFDDGLFHGDGTLYYPSRSRIEGVWEKGKCVQQNYIFSDGLRFQENNWQYCKVPDRRFVIEHIKGFEPAATSYVTNRQPTIEVPDGAYDAGDGFYWPLTNTVHDYWTNELIRVPTEECRNWIIENCHRGGKRVVGFRRELYKNWYDGTEEENDGRPVAADNDIFSGETVNYDQSIKAEIKRMVDFRPELYNNYWYGSTAGENDGEPTAADNNIFSGEIIHFYNQSVMAEIKSAPWLVLPIKSTRTRSFKEQSPSDQFSSSSSSSESLSRCQKTLGLTDRMAANCN